MRGFGEHVQYFANAHRFRIGQVKARTIEAFFVGDVIHRIDHVIDRNHIDAPAFDTDRRHPARQRIAHLLDQLEEIIRPIDFVDLAGLRVAHHHARPIDAPRHLAFITHDGFGIVFGTEVGMIEFLGFFKHILAESAIVEPGGGDGAGVMEAARLDRFGQFNGIARAIDIGRLLAGGVGREIVDRGQVKQMRDFAFHFRDVGGGDAQFWFGEIADNRHHAFLLFVEPPPRVECFEFLHRILAHQHVNRAFACQQILDQKFTDKTGGAGDEIGHGIPPEGRFIVKNDGFDEIIHCAIARGEGRGDNPAAAANCCAAAFGGVFSVNTLIAPTRLNSIHRIRCTTFNFFPQEKHHGCQENRPQSNP